MSNFNSNFISTLSTYNPLSPTEEYTLAIHTKNGDKKARDLFILSNLRFAIFYSKAFRGYKLDREDLISEAIIGLIKAVDRFDAEKGFRFTTYAKWYIRNEIQCAVGRGKKSSECNIDDEAILSLLDENQKNSIEEKYLEKDTVNCVQKAVQSLSKKEADVISRHYGLGNKKAQSFSEIAEFYSLTKVRIHQIEQKAFYTLRKYLTDLYA